MKIYSKKEFLKLPEGTFFAEGEKWLMDGFFIKMQTLLDQRGNQVDFVYLNLTSIDAPSSLDLSMRIDEMFTMGKSYPLSQDAARNGLFQDSQVFLVFEKSDLKVIKDLIDKYSEVGE